MSFPPNDIGRPGFELDFADDFGGAVLDRRKWFPHMLPHWSSLAASESRYHIGNGSLKLVIDADQEPWRPGGDIVSNLSTGHCNGQFKYDPGLQITERVAEFSGYLPRFGYFETRLRACSVAGYHTALWMIGHDVSEAGEIRVFELHGSRIGQRRSRIDFGILNWSDPALREELYEEWMPFNAAEFHVYGIDWNPDHVDFYLDNQLIRRITQSPQYPMQFMLGLYGRPQEIVPADPSPWPRVAEVDYFRGYRRLD